MGYFVSGNGALFETVCNAQRLNLLDFNIACVIAPHDCGAVKRARAHNIPVKIIPWDSLEESALNEELDLNFKEMTPDGYFLNFNKIIPSKFIQKYPYRLINIHFSLLPSFRGFHAIRSAFESSVRFTGVTTHFVTADIDSGPIINQSILPIRPDHSVESLGKDLFRQAVPLQLQVLDYWINNRLKVDANGRVQIKNAVLDDSSFAPALEQKTKNLNPSIWENVIPSDI